MTSIELLKRVQSEKLLDNNTGPTLLDLQEKLNQLKEKKGLVSKLDELLTVCHDVILIKDKVKKLAPATLSVLILGETGTGKELIAEALHTLSGRQGKFVPVNCAGIPDSILESEFFGSVKGAFTGAENKDGYIKDAEGGTLFLDEIGDMPTLLQSKLLRLLNNKKYRKVGTTEELTATFRVVSATNRINLSDNPKEFRSDLYYRLAGTVIKLPNLKERGMTDVELILKTFCKGQKSLDRAVSLTHGELKGNVRQLLNIIEECNVLFPSP